MDLKALQYPSFMSTDAESSEPAASSLPKFFPKLRLHKSTSLKEKNLDGELKWDQSSADMLQCRMNEEILMGTEALVKKMSTSALKLPRKNFLLE